MSSKYDYAALEREFIEGPLDQSIRQFAASHNITAWSTVNAQAQKRDWVAKRLDFHKRLQERTVEKIVDRTAEKVAQIRSDFLSVTHAAIIKMGLDMQDQQVQEKDAAGNIRTWTRPGIVVTPSELSKLIDRFLLLTGQPTQIGEQRSLGINLSSAGLPPEVLREIAQLTESSGADPGTARRSALPGRRSTGPN